MNYKTGDEVWVKAKVLSVDSTDKHPYEIGIVESKYGETDWVGEIDIADKTYAQGLYDAWELAKKIYHAPCDGGYSADEIKNIFGCTIGIMSKFTAEEALAKIEAYEKEKEIKVKTIVETHDGSHKGVVTLVREKGDFFVLWDNGTSDTYEKHEVKSTGRTAESLESLLRQIGE